MATNAASRITRRVYSAEELHRLRNTQSQPKLSEAIEQHDGEDADLVKEHVLRGSKSFTARSYRGRQSTSSSLRVPSNRSNNENASVIGNDALFPPLLANTPFYPGVLGDIVPNGQILRGGNFKPGRSPTPSLKRKAVEAIVKSHGSPSHIRVTAGGRIVPSEQSPLCQPRYGYSAIKMNGGLIKFAPNQRYSNRPEDLVQATDQNGQIVQDQQGNYFQIVNRQILPLPMDCDGATILHSHAPNLNFAQPPPPHQGLNVPPFDPASQPALHVPQPTVETQITTLEAERAALEEELKVINRSEATRGRDMSRAEKERLFARRRDLVTTMDRMRKSLIELKKQPPSNAPTSPRAMQNRQSPPARGRLPGFLQGQAMNATLPHQYNALFAAPQPNFSAPFGPTPSPDGSFHGTQWPYPPAGMFMPPTFDGSMAAPLSNMTSALPMLNAAAPKPAPIPQNDGTHSFADSMADLRLASSDRSRAVSIKAPDTKAAHNLKSALNPMSPVYRPNGAAARAVAPAAERRTATPLPPLHKLSASTQSASKTSGATEETVGPVLRQALIHSSSISSFTTADFFPRNPREHSTRQHVYTQPDEKENNEPEHDGGSTPPGRDMQRSAPDSGNTKAPTAPPGTPVYYSATATHAPQPAKGRENDRQHARLDIADRQAHNVSPKSKREYAFVYEQPGQGANYPSSSPPATQTPTEDAGFVDLKDKSREWLEGFTTGLQRRSFQPSCGIEWLNGYCDGLKASASRTAAPSSAITASLAAVPYNGSPIKPNSRRPSPAMPSRSSSRMPAVRNAPAASRPPFENSTSSMDCLKQAIFAPQNENALLTPAPNGLHVSEATMNLGAWAKKPHNPPTAELPGLGYPFPQRNNASGRQNVVAEGNTGPKGMTTQDRVSDHLQPTRPGLAPTLSTASIVSGSIGTGGGVPTPGPRVTSMTSIDSGMFNQWPGNRVMTPGEWRSAGFSQNTGLATGFFVQGQFDGATQRGTNSHARLSSGGRFREGSIDRVTSPSTSPRPMSPSTPPSGAPIRRDSKKSSPRKAPSPTKVKFESLAEKVGIKVTSPAPSEAGEDTAEPTSPSSKRHWGVRDWIKGGKNNNA